MNLEHDLFFIGVAKASQGSPFHVADIQVFTMVKLRLGVGWE
jgi:hypothetical protein